MTAVEVYPPKLCEDCGSSLTDSDSARGNECRHCRKCATFSCIGGHSLQRERLVAEEYANIAKAFARLETLEGSRPWNFHKEDGRPGLVGHSGVIARSPEGFWYAEMGDAK